MIQSYKSLLHSKIKEKRSSLCMGIDLHIDQIPTFAQNTNILHSVYHLSSALIEVAAKKLPAIKFQMAFFEALGADGYALLSKIIKEANLKGVITILDAKRGDISSTMAAYAEMAFSYMKASALTITPYMGLDVLLPLVPWMKKGKGIYCVFYSSNESGYSIQQRHIQNGTIAQCFLDDYHNYVQSNHLEQNFGIVVGHQQLRQKERNDCHIYSQYMKLVPGVGAQGGEIDEMITSECSLQNSNLVSISRSLAGLGDKNLKSELEHVSTFFEYEKFIENRISFFEGQFSS